MGKVGSRRRWTGAFGDRRSLPAVPSRRNPPHARRLNATHHPRPLLSPLSAHQSVLVEEVVSLLAECRRVLDGTAGAGGHALALARHGARVVAIDRDPAAVEASRERLRGLAEVRRLDFAAAPADPALRAFAPDGVLLDLGVSGLQLDRPERGFSFRPGVRLDMRMEAGEPGEGGRGGRGGRGRGTEETGALQTTAAQWLQAAEEGELAAAFRVHADEPRARALARQIVRRRARHALATSDDLVNAIRAALGPRSGPSDFARIFQAVRIVVNGELERLEAALPGLLELLAPGGVLAVIAYHSGEDRIVKRRFREWARPCVCPPRQPVCTCRGRPLGELMTKRALRAGAAEVAANPRARSARLRAFRKAA